MRAARRVLVLAAALGAVLLVAEAGLRLAGVAPRLRWFDVPLALVVPDRKLGYTLPPSRAVTYAGVTAQLDADGLRNAPAPPDQPTAILVIGDERTFGWGVADEEAYPAVLGAWLRSRCPTCGRVVNGGVPGYSTYEGVILVRNLAARLRAHVVVVAFGLNDAVLDGNASTVVELPPSLARTSVVAGVLHEWWRSPGSGWWQVSARTPPTRYARNLRAIISEVRRYGGVPVLLNLGYARDLPDPAAGAGRRLRRGRLEDDYHTSTRIAGELEYAPVVEFVGPELDATTMLDGVHPAAEGHRRIAAMLGERLEADGLVTP